jgi:hypothetical protein
MMIAAWCVVGFLFWGIVGFVAGFIGGATVGVKHDR